MAWFGTDDKPFQRNNFEQNQWHHTASPRHNDLLIRNDLGPGSRLCGIFACLTRSPGDPTHKQNRTLEYCLNMGTILFEISWRPEKTQGTLSKILVCVGWNPEAALVLSISIFFTKLLHWYMMTSSNGNIFRVTGHLCGEFTGPRWIPHTKASDAELWCLLWSAPE